MGGGNAICQSSLATNMYINFGYVHIIPIYHINKTQFLLHIHPKMTSHRDDNES